MSSGFYIRDKNFQDSYLELLYNKLTDIQKIIFKIYFRNNLSFKDTECAIDFCEHIIAVNEIIR